MADLVRVLTQHRLRRALSPATRRLRRLNRPWVQAEPNPVEPRLWPSFRLLAVLGTWMEADVVEASVANAFAQGCDRVLLVDNDSPDDTVERAVAAGAELWCRFATPQYNERLRLTIMRELVHSVGSAYGEPVWWMWLDADEFAHGPAGLRIHDFLATLDRRFRIVGARYFNHFPTDAPHYVRGRHPLDYQPMCELADPPNCALRHRKHILQLQLPNRPAIECGLGFHVAKSRERPLREPRDSILIHHFPYRNEADSRARLDILSGRGGEGRAAAGAIESEHILARARTISAVYSQDWDRVETVRGDFATGTTLAPWTELVPAADHSVRRWYER